MRLNRLPRPNALLALRLAVVLLFLLPLLWMTAAALLPPGRPLPQTLRLYPADPTLENFARIWALVPLGRFTLNSLAITAIAVPLTVITGSWAGLAIAQLPRRSQRRWVVLSLAVLMVPGIALWSTRFLIYRQLGWLDSIWALIAPAWMGTSPFYVLMFYRAFRRIPTAIYDVARLDGADALTLWRRVALPMARPTALGVALLSFVAYWGDYLSPLLYISREELYTLPIALQSLQQMNRSDWPLLMAAAVWATAVPVLLFLLMQPYFARRIGEDRAG
jgi:multiple sugar transport system permease protein